MDKMAKDAWQDLVKKTAGKTLHFLAGWRTPVELGVTCQVHSHPAIEMVYHRTGSGITRLGNRQNELVSFPEGSCVIYAPDLPHDQVMDTPGEDICVQLAVSPRIRKQIHGCLVVRNAANQLSDDWDQLSSGRRPTSELEKEILNLRATATLLAMLRECIAPEEDTRSAEHAAVRRAEEYIREHFATIDSMQEVSEQAAISNDRLRHLFREQRGTSLIAFLTQVKLERAKSLLTHSKLPLKQISTLCGFRDEYYFSSVFRRHTGQPPGAFRLKGSNKVAPN
ncbi:MAG: AraC family transcriptional regulator [Verrucomicrobiota bacterium JB024]|nr:AraC family transcriptional regulator [Verrucomicrobiota bacterium JB024]